MVIASFEVMVLLLTLKSQMLFLVTRVGLLSVAVVTSIFAFLSSISPNYISLVIFRMIVGIGLGGGPVYSSWFLEFVPVRNRGIWMVIFSTFWTVGTILEASFAWVCLDSLETIYANLFVDFPIYYSSCK